MTDSDYAKSEPGHDVVAARAEDVVPQSEDRTEPSFLRWIAELVLLVGLAFVLAMGIRTYVVQPFYIPTGSMIPTLQIGDRVLVSKFVYRFAEPERGDIVVFTSPNGEGPDLIKRVVAVGGQTIDIQEGRIIVDGEEVDEPFVNPQGIDDSSLIEPLTVPEGQVFLMGDNRANSTDSRYFGPQPVDHILGRAFYIYWPLSELGSL